MNNKTIKNCISYIFVILFISFIIFIKFFEEGDIKRIKGDATISIPENKYGLYLSSFHANQIADYGRLLSFYDEAVKQNDKDFLGKLLVLHSMNSSSDDIFKLAQEEYKKDKNNIIPVMYISNYYFVKKDYKKSMELLNSIKGKGDNFVIKLLKSWVLMGQKQYDQAKLLLEKDLDDDKNKIFKKYLLMHLAAENEISGDIKKAKQLYEEILKSENINLFDLENISAFFIKQKDKNKAIEIIKDYYKKSPDSVSALSFLKSIENNTYTPSGIDSVNKGMAKAIFDVSNIINFVFTSTQDLTLMYLSMIIELYPEFYMAKLMQAELYKSIGNSELFLSITDSIPTTHYLYITGQLNKILFSSNENNDYNTISNMYEQLALKYPDYPQIYIRMGNFYREKYDYKKSLEAFSQAIKYASDNTLLSNIYFAKAQVYDILKDKENTKLNLEKAYKLNNKTAPFLNYYGYFLIINEIDMDKGILLISEALTKDAFNSYYLDSYGWALFKRGEIEKAINILELAKSINPINPVIINHLADAYWENNRKQEAIYEWQKVLSLKKYDSVTEPIDYKEIKRKINRGL